MGSDAVIDAFSTGAVYGFVGGLLIFLPVYIWELHHIHEPETTPECPCEKDEDEQQLPRSAA